MVKTLSTITDHLIRGDRLEPVILVSSSFGTWGSKAFTIGGVIYEDKLEKIGTIDIEVKIFEGGLSNFSDLTFTLNNREKISDTLATANIDSKEVIVYLAFDIPDFPVAGLTKLYKGNVKDYKWDDEEFTINLWGNNYHIYDAKFPLAKKKIGIISSPTADPGVIGQHLPIVYGDFHATATQAYFYYGADGRTTPIVMVDAGANKFIVASHDVKRFVIGIHTPVPGGSLFQFDSGNRQLMYITTPSSSIVVEPDGSKSCTMDPRFVGVINFKPTMVGHENDADDINNVMDGPDGADYTTTKVVLDSSGSRCSVKWNPIEGLGDFREGLVDQSSKWLAIVKAVGGVGSCQVQHTSFDWGHEEEWVCGETQVNPGVGTFTQFLIPQTKKNEDLPPVDVPVTAEDISKASFAVVSVTGSIEISWMWLYAEKIKLGQTVLNTERTVTGTVPPRGMGAGKTFEMSWTETSEEWEQSYSNMYVIMQGRMYPSWIDEAGRWDDSGALTEGEIIENPMHIIESLYRDELEVGDLIDTDSFDAIAEKRKDWKGAGVIYGSGKQSKSVLNMIAKHFGIRIYHMGSYVYASAWDWWTDTVGIDSVKTFNEHNIKEDSMQLGKTQNIYNNFEIDYCYSYAWKKHRFNHYCTQTEDSHTTENLFQYVALANTNYFDGGDSIHTLSIKTNWMIHKDSGQRLLEHVVRKYTKKWYKLTFEAYHDGALTIEPGDCITIYHDRLPDVIDGKKWEVGNIGINMDRQTYEIECICAETP